MVKHVRPDPFSVTRDQLDTLLEGEFGEALEKSYVDEEEKDQKMNIIVRPLSQVYASYFASVDRLDADRELDFKRMVEIAVSTKYAFIPFTWALALFPDGTVIGINGKRTSNLFASKPELIRDGMLVVVVEHYVDSVEDAVNLWARYDKFGPIMASGLVYKAALLSIETLQRLAIKTLTSSVTVLGMEMFGEQFRKLTPEQRKCVIRPNIEFLRFIDSMILERATEGRLGQDRFLSRPVLPVVLESWRIDQEASWEFWTSVRDATESSEECNLLKEFHQYLKLVRTGAANQNAVSSSKLGEDGTFHAPSPHVEETARVAWNAWRSGEYDNHLPNIYTITSRPGPEGAGGETEKGSKVRLI